MDDIEKRMRESRPDLGERDGALSSRAQADLDAILSAEVPRKSGLRIPRWAPPAGIAAAAAAALAVVFSVVQLAVPSPSVAAPPPLQTAPVDEPLGDVMRRLSTLAEEHLPATGSPVEQTLRYEAWYSNVEVEADRTSYFVQPVEIIQSRNADWSGSITTLAGDVRWGTPSENNPSQKPGTAIDEMTFAAGEFPMIYSEPPPSDPVALRDYFLAAGWDPNSTAGDWFNAIQQLATDWQLDGPQTAAVIEFLGELPDVRVAGAVTDRLGRAGIAIDTEGRLDGAFRDTLVFDSTSGKLLSAEAMYLGGIPDLKIPYPTVFSYVAWKDTP